MGPNGSGKSTLAHALMASPVYTVTSQKSVRAPIVLDGQDVTFLARIRLLTAEKKSFTLTDLSWTT